MAKKGFLFALLLAALVNSAWAFDFYAVCSTGQTLYYNITDANNHYVEVTYPGYSGWDSYTQPTGNLTIPASVSNGSISYTVKTISNYAFAGCSGITQLTIPSSVVSIGQMAFHSNGFTTLTLPSSLKTVGSYAFYNNYSLTTISFTNSLVEVGEDAFGNVNTPWYQNQPDGLVYTGSVLYKYKGTMPSNTNVTVPSGIKGIAGQAFVNCSNLSSITLPNTLKCIGKQAFYSCTGLNSITIPASVTKICEGAFMDCGYITSVNYNAQICYTDMTGYAPFQGCYSLSTVTIGSGVQRIPANLFRDCDHLSGTLSLPSSLKRIDNYAFYGCSGITGNLTIPSSMDTLGYYAFYGCSGITSITYNATNCNTQNGYGPFYNCLSVSSITLGSSVQTIPPGLFRELSNATGNLMIPNSVVSIGASAFNNCSGFTSVTLGTGLTQIGAGAFYGMTSLQSITLNSINCHSESIGFMGDQINSLTIANNVQFIPEYFIYYSPSLTSVSLPNSLMGIGDYAFYHCGLSGSLTIPQLVTSIGTATFGDNVNLTTIEMMSTNPPLCEATSLIGNYNATLIVPCGCVSAYQNAPVWSYFTDIHEPAGCTHQISASAYPSNGGTVSGGGTYNSGANCTLIATPNANSIFINWTENGTPVSSNASYSFTVLGDRTLVANFQYQQPSTFTITASASPANGGTISGTGTYDQGATCTLSASPSSGYVFLRWTENGNQVSTNPTYSFTVNGNRTLVANFQYDPPTYTINASANPSNGGSISGAGTFIEGQVCTLTASPNSSFVFLKWTENGTQVSTNPTYSFTVNSNRTLVAHFQSQPSQYTVTLSANPNNGGSVSGGGTYTQGQTCNITANANPNYSFENWTENGTQVSANSTYSFTVTGNRTLVANFSYSPIGYVINATAEPSYGGLVSGAGTYNQGRTCTLIATPNPNYDFVNWTEGGNVVSTSPTYSFTVNGNRTLVAHFESQVYTISVSANPLDGGTVYGGGDYSAGITCHLIAVPNNNYSFLNWTENGVAVSSESDYSFVVTGNRTLTANFVFYDAIEESTNNIMVYPNPTNDVVFIKGCEVSKVEVYDLMGQLLMSKENLGENATISLRHLSSGLY